MARQHPSPAPTATAGPAEPWTVGRRKTAQAQMPPLTHRYHVTHLTADGRLADLVRMGPSMPLFHDSFAVIARGAVVPTSHGPVAIEDLVPGTEVVTTDGPLPLLWKGMVMLAPRTNGRGEAPLVRIPAGALGPGRPAPDLLLGASARTAVRAGPACAGRGAARALVPISERADGQTVIGITPVSPMPLFQIGFDGHRTVEISGVEIETVHPGRIDTARVGPDLLRLYLPLFPHLDRGEGFGELCLPRIGDGAATAQAAL